MRGLLTFAAGIVGIAGTWAYVDRSWAVAAPAEGGPFLQRAEGCAPPRPSADAVLVMAGFYEGAGISTVRLAAETPQQEGTSAVDVHISPGFGSIYLVVAPDRNTVLRFSGWTRRLERVVVLADARFPAGVTGLPRGVVAFADRGACGITAEQLYHPERTGAGANALAQRLGRARPDAVGGGYNPYQLAISGAGVGARIYDGREHARGVEEEWGDGVARFSPAGVLQVEAGQVVANVAAAPYRVLPGHAGLAQLVREGKLRRRYDTYRLLAPIDAPEGLYGAESVTFELTPGMPRPRGDVGHSRVVTAGLR